MNYIVIRKNMHKIFFIILLCIIGPSIVFAHICNDIFRLAKYHLAVKVDIRDNQLRLNKTGKFRVYLLNTTGVHIANIQLEIESDYFYAEVKPDPDWNNFPRLNFKKAGGEKHFFDVTLHRRPNTKEGKYKINLRLCSGLDKSKTLKRMDFEDETKILLVPKNSSTIQIDGRAFRHEWQNSLLCSSFYEYFNYQTTQNPRVYFIKEKSSIQTRVRFSYDDKNLYCMLDFGNTTTSIYDVIYLFIAQNQKDEPAVIAVDLHEKKACLLDIKDVNLNKRYMEIKSDVPIFAKFGENKSEMILPYKTIRIKNSKIFYVNLLRIKDHKITYWRGNKRTFKDSIVYANFSVQ